SMSIWAPIDPDITAKSKYAKFHAVRIAKAIKAGEDPNASNPVQEELPEAPAQNTYHPPTVESAPESQYPSRPASIAQPEPTTIAPPTAQDAVSPVESTNPRQNSIGGGYFPSAPAFASDPAPSVAPATNPATPFVASAPTPAVDAPASPSQYYTQPTQPPVSIPMHSPAVAPPPAAAPVPLPPVQPVAPGTYRTDDDSITLAQKHAKWAMSALNFEDVDTAVKELSLIPTFTMQHRVCFAPDGHPVGSHADFQSSPFGFESPTVWIGYLDKPKKTYRHFITLQAVIEKAQYNFAKGYKDQFPRYLITCEGRPGRDVPLDEEMKYTAQCSACKGKTNCDRMLVQYFPVDVWDYARGRRTTIFLCALVFKIKGHTMLSLLRHRSHGKFGFQHITGAVSKEMTVEFASSEIGLVDEESVISDEAEDQGKASIVIDLTLDDEDDEATVKTEQGNTLQTNTETSVPSTQNHPSQLDPVPQVDLMKEFAGMMAEMVANFGIDALGQPEARRLRLCMGAAAEWGDKALLCQHFGTLHAVLEAGQ
ncbi:DUF605-domain-containing protein, partial [Aureobasidium melanogenum]